MNRSDSYLPHCFALELDGVITTTFSRCEGLESEKYVYEVEEGGYGIHRFEGRTRFPNLILEKGISTCDDLYRWYYDVIHSDKPVERRSGSVILMDQSGEEVKRWNFFRALPCRWIGPTLDFRANGIAVERIELIYEDLWLDGEDDDKPIMKSAPKEETPPAPAPKENKKACYENVSDHYKDMYDNSFEQLEASDPVRHYVEITRPSCLLELGFIVPVDDPIVTENYGFCKLFYQGEEINRWHGGIDYDCPLGDPVYAAHSGYIRFDSSLSDAYGNSLFIDYAKQFPNDKDVPFFKVSSQYSHLSTVSVENGQWVEQGQIIGSIGSTGMSTNPHLDFRTHINGKLINPSTFYF